MAGERVLLGGRGGGGREDPMSRVLQSLLCGVSRCFMRRRRFAQQTIEIRGSNTTTQKVMTTTTSDIINVVDRISFRSGEFPVSKKNRRMRACHSKTLLSDSVEGTCNGP